MPDDEKRRVIWVVTPHQLSDFDECWMPGETDEDHERAREYAHERLEEAWDQQGPDEPPATVTIGQRWVDADEYPESETEEAGDG